MEHVWAWFLDLSASRSEYRPISHSELLAFFSLADIRPLPVELEAVRLLDREWILHKANSANKGRSK